MPLQSTSGAASYDAFGGGVAAVPKYIEDYFSTFLYTDNGSTQTINNGIDLAGKGGFVWAKCRSAVDDHIVWDSARGTSNYLIPNKTNAQATYAATFNSNGVSIPSLSTGQTYTSWSLAKAPKFFDVVTYTGNGTNGRTVAHSLGSVPGCMIVKRTDASNGWAVYHRSMNASPQDYMMRLNATDGAFTTSPSRWNNTLPTSTEFTLSGNDEVNGSGATYVAYLFAHDAGGFGLTGTDNVISCGSFTTDAGGSFSVNLGYEPQWMMIKCSSDAQDWQMFDNMRGLVTQPTAATARLTPNTSAAENSTTNDLGPTATGFESIGNYGASRTYIYIAIRRGPMKVPTDATKVFTSVARSGTSATATITAGFPVDLEISKTRNAGNPSAWFDRLRGATYWLRSSGTNAEATTADSLTSFASNTGVTVGADAGDGIINFNTSTYANWMFGRAPSFFDEVCFTTTDGTYSGNHNLGVVPELLIFKSRDGTGNWQVVSSYLTSAAYFMRLNSTIAEYNNTNTNYTATSTTLTIPNAGFINFSATMVAYLFATCAGVSKVGSYTGTGTTLQVNCGFTAGARFVLIKRTDSTGDWYVWDSARGIVSGNDPYLLLNSTAAEVTSTDYVDTYSAGFEISSTAPAAINASGGTFIFFAVA